MTLKRLRLFSMSPVQSHLKSVLEYPFETTLKLRYWIWGGPFSKSSQKCIRTHCWDDFETAILKESEPFQSHLKSVVWERLGIFEYTVEMLAVFNVFLFLKWPLHTFKLWTTQLSTMVYHYLLFYKTSDRAFLYYNVWWKHVD